MSEAAVSPSGPLETVPVEFEEVLIDDQLVVEFDQLLGARTAITGRVTAVIYNGSDPAIVLEDPSETKYRVDEEAVEQFGGRETVGENPDLNAVREVVR